MNETGTVRCLVVDDEPPAREIISRYIGQVPMLTLAGECTNAIQAFSFLQQTPVDLLFLDIRMPQLNGNDFLKTLKSPPKTIFTTAYQEYALEGFDLDVVDYLMKPIPFDRFFKAVNKAMVTGTAVKETLANENKAGGSFVYFRADRKMIKVMLSDILYVESMKDYVKVVLAGQTIITKQSISSVEAMLPEKEFARVHRSFIISLSKVTSFSTELIDLGKNEIPIGKLYRQSILKILG
ncbi:MAG: response regulator transcription factor [Chitinophagaceae bacterium]|nr:MAG: response regulator transcription factor [Chitinophagaceae bacterium]